MDIFISPIWTFVGVVFALVSVIIAIITIRQPHFKRISYKIIYDAIVFRAPNSAAIEKEIKGIEINYVTYKDASKKEKEIEKRIEENIYLVKLKIWNSGNQTISEKDDYLDEDMKLIEIDFGEEAQVLDIQDFRTNPEKLKDKIGEPKFDKKIISFQSPPYLQKASFISLNVLLTKYKFENVKVNTPPIKGELAENDDKTLFARITNNPSFFYVYIGFLLFINLMIGYVIASIIYGIIFSAFSQMMPKWFITNSQGIFGVLVLISFFLSFRFITPPLGILIQKKTPNIPWEKHWEKFNDNNRV